MLKLEAEDITNLNWYVDSLFGTHPDFKSHTGSIFGLGKGIVWNDSTKQKVNARNSTEVELIAIDNKISKIIWMKRFLVKYKDEYFIPRYY